MNTPLRILALFSLAGLAQATDYYVDAALGSDVTGNGSPAQPWLTIRHSLTQVTSPPVGNQHVIHVAPGVYDAALGEVFPLAIAPRLQVIGAAAASTIVDGGGGATALFEVNSNSSGPFQEFGPDTRIEGFTLRGAETGVRLSSTWLDASPTLHGLVIENCNHGIWASAYGLGGLVEPVIEMLTVIHNDIGMELESSGGFAKAVVSDSVFAGNTTYGIRLETAGGSTYLVIDRTRLEANGNGISVRYTNEGYVDVAAERCSLSSNLQAGFAVEPDMGIGGFVFSVLRYCTIADNDVVGVVSEEIGTGLQPTALHGCIVYHNGTDVITLSPGTESVDATYCNIGTGTYRDLAGNISVNPLFWNKLGNDWMLQPASPCIDAGDPTDPPDADGTGRDIGAYPYDAGHMPVGGNYCIAAPNSVGAGATISALGTARIVRNDLVLRASGCPPNEFGLFYRGRIPIQLPFGDGFRCIGGEVFRMLPVLTIQPDGSATYAFNNSGSLGLQAPVLAGSIWDFQFWYRDQDAGGSSFNLTDAAAVLFGI